MTDYFVYFPDTGKYYYWDWPFYLIPLEDVEVRDGHSTY
jgi:hypothetical protein